MIVGRLLDPTVRVFKNPVAREEKYGTKKESGVGGEES